jgi:DNA-binding MarR family transcriptional regulator
MATPKKPRSDLRTISRAAMLVNGTDEAFRDLIHDLMVYTHHLTACRDGFGAIIGLTGVQYEIFMIVRRFGGAGNAKADDAKGGEHRGGISVGQVAARLHRSGAFTTIEAAKMVGRGILQKRTDPADGRKVLLALTPAGEALARTLAPYQQKVNDVLFESLDRRRFDALSATVRDLVASGDGAVALSDFRLAQATQGAARAA